MSLRVIAGSAKGKRLKRVPGDSTRPVMDRVKEAVFSIIGYDIIDTNFLDLFAGTGSIGIEALSRGADQATFWDLDKHAIKTIYENLKTTGFEEQAVVRRTDSIATLKRSAPTTPFDFIYIAPPQYKSMWLDALVALDENPQWLNDDIELIVQIDPKEYAEHTFKHFEEYDSRIYGKTQVCFYQMKDSTSEGNDT